MTPRFGHGTITGGGGGLAVKVGAALLPLPATHERLTDWAAGVLPCPHCGMLFGCDCLDWLEWMAMVNTNAAAEERENDES